MDVYEAMCEIPAASGLRPNKKQHKLPPPSAIRFERERKNLAMEYVYDPVAGTIARKQPSGDETTTTNRYTVRVKNRRRCDCDPEKSELRHVFPSAADALDYINKLNENRMQTLRRGTGELYKCRVCDVDRMTPPHIHVIGEIRFREGADAQEEWKVIDADAERTLTFRRGDRVVQYIRARKDSKQEQ